MKYLGSKQKISKDIVPIIQDYINKNNISIYIEPFCGGANIIDKIKCDTKIGNDIDTIPISIINACKKNSDLLKTLPDCPTKEHYYDVRDNPNKYALWYRSAILLFASYNSRVYGGCYGAYAKTKDGKIRNYFQEAIKNFEKQLPKLQDTIFCNLDYKYLYIPKNSLIYCDIPYKNGVGYSVDFDYDYFYQWCINQKSQGCIVLVSEYNMPNDKFDCIWSKEIKTHLNNRNKLNKIEKLFIVK